MYIKANTVIPAGVKVVKCKPSIGKGKSIYTLLRAEEKKLEKQSDLKAKANKLTACLKAGYSVPEAIKLIDGKNIVQQEHLPPAIEGSFHGQGYTTSGKIVNKRFAYENKNTGDRGYGSTPQQERHIWSWDHKNKKWNYVRTIFGSATR